MRDRTVILICLTLSMAWVTIAAVYLYPDVKEEFEQHRYLRRIGKLHTPVIPIECPRARGIENQDFIREDKNPNRCWVDLASFRRNYPEIAEATDVAATVLANLREEPPLENWDGTTIGAVLRATSIAMSGPLALFLVWLWRTRQVAQRAERAVALSDFSRRHRTSSQSGRPHFTLAIGAGKAHDQPLSSVAPTTDRA